MDGSGGILVVVFGFGVAAAHGWLGGSVLGGWSVLDCKLEDLLVAAKVYAWKGNEVTID